MAKNNKDLLPWLDYFDMFRRYEQIGYLELYTERHEAYVTQPALHAMTPGDDPQQQLQDNSIIDTVRRLQGYAAFRSTEGKDYLKQPFALNVVQAEPPYDLLYTMLITHHKSWRTLWRWRDSIETITY